MSTPQPATVVPASVTRSQASVSAHHALCPPTAWCASPRPSAATRWWAVRSVTAQGLVSRSSPTLPVTWTAASASERLGRGPCTVGEPRAHCAPRSWKTLSRWGPHGFGCAGRSPGLCFPGRCRPNVAGRRCDTCAPGFHGYPSCHPCDCHEAGTAPGVCDPLTGRCYCKVRGACACPIPCGLS